MSKILALAEKYMHVHFVDVYNDFINSLEYYLDNTHMNGLDYEILTQKILSVNGQTEYSKRKI